MAVGFLEILMMNIEEFEGVSGVLTIKDSTILLMIIGCVTGAIFGAVSADIFGRKRTLLATTICVIGGITDICLQNSIGARYVLSLTGGINAGIACTVVPVYISEIADDNIRGGLLMLQLFGIYAGQFIVVVGGITIIHFCLIVIPILFLIAILWFPESPYYLASKKQYEAATESLAFFRGIDREAAKEEVQVVIDAVKEDGSSKGMCQTSLDLFRSKNRKGLIIVALLIILQRDRTFISDSARLADALQYIISIRLIYALIIMCGIQLIWSGILVFGIDKVGRRLSLLGSTLVSLFIVSSSTIVIMDRSYIFFTVKFTLHLCQIVTFGVPLVFVAELFPTNVRSTASCTAVIFRTIFKSAIVWMNWRTWDGTNVDFSTFIPLYLISFLSILAFVPETKQSTFSDIQNALAGARLKCERNTALQLN